MSIPRQPSCFFAFRHEPVLSGLVSFGVSCFPSRCGQVLYFFCANRVGFLPFFDALLPTGSANFYMLFARHVVGILGGVFVAVFTVCCRRPVGQPPSKVFSACDDLKVVGIDATTIAAEMVEIHTFGYGFFPKLIRKTMGSDPSAPGIESTVTSVVGAGGPHPTTRFLDGEFLPKPLFDILSGHRSNLECCMVFASG